MPAANAQEHDASDDASTFRRDGAPAGRWPIGTVCAIEP
jgi:hypothetical protein